LQKTIFWLSVIFWVNGTYELRVTTCWIFPATVTAVVDEGQLDGFEEGAGPVGAVGATGTTGKTGTTGETGAISFGVTQAIIVTEVTGVTGTTGFGTTWVTWVTEVTGVVGLFATGVIGVTGATVRATGARVTGFGTKGAASATGVTSLEYGFELGFELRNL